MRPDKKVELTSNIADDTVFDEQGVIFAKKPAEKPEGQPQLSREEPYTDKELEPVMGLKVVKVGCGVKMQTKI